MGDLAVSLHWADAIFRFFIGNHADREPYKGQMVAGDILDESTAGPVALIGGIIDIAHAASFFHLCDLEGHQVKAGVQLVQLI